MEITGFDEQIGFLKNLKNQFKKNLPQTNFFKKIAQQARPNIRPSSGLFSAVKKAAQQARPNIRPSGGLFSAVKKAAQQARPNVRPSGGLFSAVKKIAQKTGKSVIVKTPSGFKKLTPKPVFNLVPTAKAKQASFIRKIVAPVKTTEISKFQNSLQAMKPAAEAKAIFNLTPSPNVVRQLDPIQRSYLKTDLPYKVISKNNFGQPTTKFIKNTPLKFNIDIDQIQPSVDSGIINYYGK
jgi:hypothetical protein